MKLTSLNGGLLVINADDWGHDRRTTDCILDCATQGRISTVSAMVFMEDSARAAELSHEHGLCPGLHLNLTEAFSPTTCAHTLMEKQRQIATWLRGHRYSRGVFHPGLRSAFQYVVAAQLNEFQRLYGARPARIDGHHHMHLSPNVLLSKLLPAATALRRNFSFRPGEKGKINRFYRSAIDRVLARRHVLTDYFFALAPLEPIDRLQDIFSLASRYTVEVETHPANEPEYNFLLSDRMLELIENIRLARPSGVCNGLPV
jgi:predicted glycoside hydrolase/deacetylase ChbG (UPF0249 family)